MIAPLIAYDADGNIVATLDHMVARNEDGNVIGLMDFAAHEEAGKPLLDIWNVHHATGSGTWPEWLGKQVENFKVERANGRITALVHKSSGRRRERAAIEAAIEKRVKAAKGEPADLRDLVGGPGKPLRLDEQGRTRRRELGKRPELPVIRGGSGSGDR